MTHRQHLRPRTRLRRLAVGGVGMILFALLGDPAPAVAEDATTETKTQQAAGIVWYATLESGLAEARRTGKPILLMSAAPHCRNISGMW